MVIRLVFLLILVSAVSFASTCVNCHEKHHTDAGSCFTCHRGDGRSSRENIAHAGLITSKYADFQINKEAVKNGELVVDKANCRRCHTIDEKGNKLALNLDESASKNTGELLQESINKPNDFMPDFRFNVVDTADIVKYMLSVSGEENIYIRKPYVIYVKKNEDVFDKKCGGCHKALILQEGSTGRGDSAPNLSGLGTRYFQSKVLRDNERWDKDKLKKWIDNPRSISKQTIMPPAKLTKDELEYVYKLLDE
ncbi:MAG: cytochrome C [Denitrovibrio sp.]|nr:MAG: cytochrome C [Denitrovibrio sp.]